MPKRSNEFQKLAFLIHSHFAQNASVTESKMLHDRRSGSAVEVDIVVDANISGYPIVIGIECTAKSRPATVEWVRGMIGKHQDLPLDKSILISKSGFTSEARKKAESHGFEALTLADAEDGDWIAYVNALTELRMSGFTFTIKNITIKLRHPEKLSSNHLLTTENSIKEPGAESKGTVNDYAIGSIHDSVNARVIMKKWVESPDRFVDFTFDLTWTPLPETVVVDSSGIPHELSALTCKVSAHVDDAALKLTPSFIHGKKYAHGIVDNLFGTENPEPLAIVLEEKNGDLGPGSILMSSSDGTVIRSVIPETKNNGNNNNQ